MQLFPSGRGSETAHAPAVTASLPPTHLCAVSPQSLDTKGPHACKATSRKVSTMVLAARWPDVAALPAHDAAHGAFMAHLHHTNSREDEVQPDVVEGSMKLPTQA